MKYKFYDDPPELNLNEPAELVDSRKHTKEINWAAKNMNLDVNKFRVDDVTFGDPVLFYQGRYVGYLDNLFYRAFDVDDSSGWWCFDN